jgi:nitrate/TMAO reductase-like tetraheme cytochrome c subunit
MMRLLAVLVVFALLSAGDAAELTAQARTASPHGKLGAECADCHRGDAWRPLRTRPAFRHASTGFPLEGAHGSAECRSCHEALDFKGAASTCASCHADPHRGELGPDCASCHTVRSFLDRAPMERAHDATSFPLVGAHRAVDCSACHAPSAQGGFQFVGQSTECVSCHRAEYAAARDPDHAQGGLPTECAQCHSSTRWDRGRFNHDAGAFPLTGAHRAVRCVDCHTTSRYSDAPTACVGCHQRDYDGTTDPAHAGAGFSTNCQDCHGTASWDGAAFNHDRSGFPLTGAHRSTPCDRCHAGNRYSGTPTSCEACHRQDYDKTTDPGHAAAGFPTDCASCHTTATWNGARFDHDAQFFRIYSGEHRGEWTTCADCHDNAASYAQFTCLSCHEHNRADMDREHRGRNGYQYVSTECLRCHENP